MKKLTTTLLSALLALSLAACGNDNQDRETDTLAESPVQTGESESGGNTENGSGVSEDDGNPAGGNGAAGDGGSTENGNGAAGDGGSTENGNGESGDGGSTDGGNGESGDGGSADGDNGASGSNILVAYFSVMETDGVDTVAGAWRWAGKSLATTNILPRSSSGRPAATCSPSRQYRNTPAPTNRFWILHMRRRRTMPGRSLRRISRIPTAMTSSS